MGIDWRTVKLSARAQFTTFCFVVRNFKIPLATHGDAPREAHVADRIGSGGRIESRKRENDNLETRRTAAVNSYHRLFKIRIRIRIRIRGP